MLDFSSSIVLLNELNENIESYQLSSNFNFSDPEYAEAQKDYSDFYKTIYKTFWIGNLSIADNIVIDLSETLEYGTMPCHAPGKNAFVDSNLACFLFQLPFFLEKIQFGYISLLLVIPIIAISIFGGIKESYRWYLLNQGIWDALVCYDFICEKPTLIGWNFREWGKHNTCFYNYSDRNINTYTVPSASTIIQDVFRFSAFIPICLLAFSRFIGIYFPTFYQKVFSKSWRSIAFILIFNCTCILLICARKIIFLILVKISSNSTNDCIETLCIGEKSVASLSTCTNTNVKFFQCIIRAQSSLTWLNKINNAKITNFLALSIFCAANIFAFLLLIKLISQLRFQLKSKNRQSFISMIKISAVIAFQCFTMSIIFVASFIQFDLYAQAVPDFGIKLYNFQIYKKIPVWLFFLQYSTTTLSFNIIRIFLDSFIILTVLSGYSECMKKVLKFLGHSFIHPKTTFTIIKQKLKFRSRAQPSLFVMSSFQRRSSKTLDF